jgi:hypothetical protein
VYDSVESHAEQYHIYVKDDKDLQVLKDAVEIKATHILTYNLKDFRIQEIEEDFGILIINNLDNL